MKILAYTSPAKGHLFPIMPTLLTLHARGHAVAVRTLASEVGRLQALGLDAAPIAAGAEARENDDYLGSNPLASLQRVLRAWLDRAPHEAADLSAAVDALRPDALLIDVNAWGALAAAEASGLPFAVWSPYLLDAELPGRPPFGPGLAPWPTRCGRLRDRLVREVLRRGTAGAVAGFNTLRAGLGAPPIAAISDLPLRGEALLYLTAEPFEYGHGGWSPKVHMVGPGIWEPADAPWTPPSDKPIVLVTCSTEFQDDGRLAEVALQGLVGDDVHVVVTTGAVDPARLPSPPGATVTRFAPHGPILARAAVVVCHGGMGITQKALAAGVPVCVVPFGRDQLEVARRVVEADAGATLSNGALRPDRLAQAVATARQKKAGAERIARAFAAAGGPAAAADVVERIATR